MKVLSTFTDGDEAISHAKALYAECDGKQQYCVLKDSLTNRYDVVKIESQANSFVISTKGAK